jgi:hypothetical protein
MGPLILLCRSEFARSYISEAVSCYNARAYRSAIIATWIAVLFDFIHKLRELEMAGDNAARLKLTTFDAARSANDLKASLEFERNLVDSARDDFQLISPVEAIGRHQRRRLGVQCSVRKAKTEIPAECAGR